ncbi:MAG TPA: S8 family serine peptidase [Thermoanaerobaculia bacterium]
MSSHRQPPALAFAALLGLAGCALILAGCASGGGPSGVALPGSARGNAVSAANAPEVTARQVMVTLRTAPPFVWTQTTREIELNYRLRTVAAWTMDALGERCIIYGIETNRSAAQVVRQLTGDPRVGTVQVIQTFETLAESPTPAAPPPASGAHSRLQRWAEILHLTAAHRLATGRGVRVAVVDTGVDVGHPDLKNRIKQAKDFVRGNQPFTSDIHGTAVAGTIAADESEGRVVGVAPEAEIFAFKACWPQPPGSRQAVCNSYTLALAINQAIVERAQIMNLSLAGPDDPLLGRLLKNAMARGITVVAAEAPAGGKGSFPASLDGVIGVVAADLDGGLRSPAPASSRLAAPGVDVLSTAPNNSYDFFTGSSFAAAEVSGIAALLLERNPKLTPAQVREALVKSARPIRMQPGDPDPDVGLVDACAAVAHLAGGTC